MKKNAIVVDWLDKYGGAERVIAKFIDIFKFKEIYTLTNIMNEEDLSKIMKNNASSIKDTILRVTGKRFRWFYVFFFFLIGKIKINSEVDYFISSSHSVAKGVKKSRPDQIHISYFQARNSNYIWDEVDLYFGKLKYLFYPLIYVLRRIDVSQSSRPDYIISNSKFVQNWVKEIYNRESEVIYPPVDFSKFHLTHEKEDYYVAVGRLASIKRFDIIINVFNSINKKLYIIGDGEQANYLKKLAKSPNITFTGFLETAEVNKYISKSKGFIQLGIEGFGIAALEAQACGTPVIAYGEGGSLETIQPNKTGVLFYNQDEESLLKAIDDFEKLEFDREYLRNHALQFSEENFEVKIKNFVEKIIEKNANDSHLNYIQYS